MKHIHLHLDTKDGGPGSGPRSGGGGSKPRGGPLEQLRSVVKERGHEIAKVTPTDKGTAFLLHPQPSSHRSIISHIESRLPRTRGQWEETHSQHGVELHHRHG